MNFLLFELSMIRTNFPSPWEFELWRVYRIYILSRIIYFIHPLTIMFTLTIKVIDVLQRVMVISKIKYDFFLIWIFCHFRLKKILLHIWIDEKKNTTTLNLFHVLYMLRKFLPEKVLRLFFDPHKSRTICSTFNSPWKIENFCCITNLS